MEFLSRHSKDGASICARTYTCKCMVNSLNVSKKSIQRVVHCLDKTKILVKVLVACSDEETLCTLEACQLLEVKHRKYICIFNMRLKCYCECVQVRATCERRSELMVKFNHGQKLNSNLAKNTGQEILLFLFS